MEAVDAVAAEVAASSTCCQLDGQETEELVPASFLLVCVEECGVRASRAAPPSLPPRRNAHTNAALLSRRCVCAVIDANAWHLHMPNGRRLPALSASFEALPALVVLTCIPSSSLLDPPAWCDAVNATHAEAAALEIAGSQHLSSTHMLRASAEDFPLAAFRLEPHRDLPALLWLPPRSSPTALPSLLSATQADLCDDQTGLPCAAQQWLGKREGTNDADDNLRSYWTQRILGFAARVRNAHLLEVPRHLVFARSAPPAELPPIWSAQQHVVHSTAATLEADVAALHGRCALLLVHDSRLEADSLAPNAPSSSTAAATTTTTTTTASSSSITMTSMQRWRALAHEIALATADDPLSATAWPPRSPLLQLDLAHNDVPPTPLGATIREALKSTGLPGFLRIGDEGRLSAGEPPSVAGVPARRVRSDSTLHQWALAHMRSCLATARAESSISSATPTAAAGSAETSSGAKGNAGNGREWVRAFVEHGLPTLGDGLDEILRSRASSRVRRRAAAIGQEHTRLVDRRARAMFAANPDAELLLAHERAQENDIALTSVLDRLEERLRMDYSSRDEADAQQQQQLEARAEQEQGEEQGEEQALSTGGGMMAAELLREAELRLQAARAFDDQLAQAERLSLQRTEVRSNAL